MVNFFYLRRVEEKKNTMYPQLDGNDNDDDGEGCAGVDVAHKTQTICKYFKLCSGFLATAWQREKKPGAEALAFFCVYSNTSSSCRFAGVAGVFGVNAPNTLFLSWQKNACRHRANDYTHTKNSRKNIAHEHDDFARPLYAINNDIHSIYI